METTVRKKTSFLKGRSKEAFAAELKLHLNAHATEAYIFGSFFSEDFDADSDLDLAIVANCALPFHQRIQIFPELTQFLDQNNVPVDVLIYTPAEFEELQLEGRESKVGFWKNFISSSKKIYP